MNKHKLSKLLNLLMIIGLILAVYIWQTTWRKVSSNPLTAEARISFLDVGQANAALINLPNSTQILLDSGRDVGVGDELSSRMPPYDKKIEFVVLSHPDADHIGGLETVLKSYEIGEIIKTKAVSTSKLFERIEKTISEKRIKVVEPSAGDKINFNPDAEGFVLSPDESKVGSMSLNDSSLIVRFCYKTACTVFPGDAEVAAEQAVKGAFEPKDLQAEIFEVSHHGSSNGLDKELIREINPKYAVISVGKDNTYGHPTKVVLDFLNGFGVDILRTDQKGTIDFDFENNQWVLK